uniref:Protein N-terminal asparagine amidohydrolase n=1 Tax=Erpetoichthys calabaricus TaxID=27687 RepID=A0A8C4SXG8_ERPCA
MPLFVNGERIASHGSTGELFKRYPELQITSKAFREKKPETIDSKLLLYVQQRELAATTPADSSVTVIGSDDATTCHLVILRHTGSGATCLAHCDGSSTRSEVSLIIKTVRVLTANLKEGRFELHLIGGFLDDLSTSCDLSRQLLAAFSQQKEDIHLLTCCITELNDSVVCGIHRPMVYGVGVNVKTGEIFPATFPHRGPEELLRSARTFTGGQMVNIYDSPGEQIRIGPYSWLSNKDISVWLEQDDQTILKHMSTSPLVEPPHFVTHMKATIQFLLENPRAETLFPGGQSHVYKRSAHGSWDKAADCAVPVHHSGGNN